MAIFQAFYSGYLMIEADSEEEAADLLESALDYVIDESRLEEYSGDYQTDEIVFISPVQNTRSIT